MEKRGISGVIATVLLIVIVLVAIIIVWNVVNPFLKKSSEDMGNIDNLAISLNIDKSLSLINQTGPSKIVVTRDSAEGNFDGLKFIFRNSDDMYIETRYEKISAFGTRVFNFNAYQNLTNVSSVEIYPVIKLSSGKEKTGAMLDRMGESEGSGIYTEQPSGCAQDSDCPDPGECKIKNCTDNQCIPTNKQDGTSCSGGGVCSNGNCAGCVNGATQSCYSGLSGTSDIGLCHNGTKTCSSGVWGSCVGEVIPATEVCTGNLDEDCDGQVDCADSDCTSNPACAGQISGCQDLNQANTVYTLQTGNPLHPNGNCFNILANNITLNCQGRAIIGTSSMYGVNITGYNYTIVKKCDFTSFGSGIYGTYANNSQVLDSNITINGGDKGIWFEYSAGVYIKNNIIYNGTSGGNAGIYLANAKGANTISDNKINDMKYSGIWISSTSYAHTDTIERNLIINTQTYNCGSYCGVIDITGGSGHNINNNNITKVPNRGIFVFSSSGNIIHDNRITNAVQGACKGLHISSVSNSQVYDNYVCSCSGGIGNDLVCEGASTTSLSGNVCAKQSGCTGAICPSTPACS